MTDSASNNQQIIPASSWLLQHISYLPKFGQVLDLACGSGRHSCLLASLGYSVLAVDRNAEALAGLAQVKGIVTAQYDLEGDDWPLVGQSFTGIVVTNYLWRPRLPDLLKLLAPGGVLIYQTFMLGNEAYGKPSNPEFLLRSGELREVVMQAGLHEIAFEEGYSADPKPAMIQAICALRE